MPGAHLAGSRQAGRAVGGLRQTLEPPKKQGPPRRTALLPNHRSGWGGVRRILALLILTVNRPAGIRASGRSEVRADAANPLEVASKPEKSVSALEAKTAPMSNWV